jgi:type IV pilus assembly protein PilY1
MKKLISILPLLALLASPLAHAVDQGACNVQSTSRLDSILNPAKGSDERFFSSPAGAPNILVILDTSNSMRWWPMPWRNDNDWMLAAPYSVPPPGRWATGYYSYDKNPNPVVDAFGKTQLPGCRQEDIDALGYDKSATYQQMWKDIGNSPTDSKTPSSEYYNTSKYYFFRGLGDTDGLSEDPGKRQTSMGMGSAPVPFFTEPPPITPDYRTLLDADTACKRVVTDTTGSWPSIPAATLNACKACLDSKGYFQYSETRRVAKGNFLNFYSPRGHTAASVLSQIIDEAPGVRFSFMAFSHANNPNAKVWANNPSLPNVGVTFLNKLGPACPDSYSLAKLQEHRNNIVKGLQYLQFNVSTPLTSTLYAAAHYFRSSKSATDPWTAKLGSYPTNTDFNDEANPLGAAAICTTCSFNAVILLTDGAPAGEWTTPQPPKPIRDLTTPCDSCGTYAAPVGDSGGGAKSHVHRVADFLWNNDQRADLTGVQRVATYTVGFALFNEQALNLLRATAKAGGGKFYAATHSAELKKRLQQILDEVQSRNLSFSAAAISSFQTGTGQLSALLPRMVPASDAPWQGRLYRFNQFNEFVEEVDKNNDGDQTDIFITDTDGDIVNEQGSLFIKKSASAGAKHFWEANEVLEAAVSVDTSVTPRTIKGRKIYTVTDSNDDGRFTHVDEVIEFSMANKAKLKDYLGILGTSACPRYVTTPTSTVLDNGAIINGLASDIDRASSVLGLTKPATTPIDQTWLNDLCLAVLVEYVRGMDFSTTSAKVRTGLMGDIFHSAPIVVQPPVDKFLCDLGISNQCVRTIYSQNLGGVPATPLVSETVNRCSKSVDMDAYEAYAHTYRMREKLVLVGANDGMLHAFVDSVASETCNNDLPFVTHSATRVTPNRAREPGQELWAFIPPDLLPRLQEMIQGHTYYVDGDIMVRDVWADGSGSKAPAPNGKKEWDEFRTMAIVAEGRGGVHYFALELASNPGTGKFEDKPVLRWMYPQPDSEEAALFGKTLFALTPKAPPVGPVLVEPTDTNVAISRYNVNTEERWMVMLSGGWSPGLEKGRGIYMVDAFHGQVNGRTDNLWWKFDYNPTASNDRELPRKYLTHSVVAPVAMVDYGRNGAQRLDGFFDTAVFGDTRGQLWVARFTQPGKLSASSPKLVENWAAARSFQMDRDNPDSAKKAWPFHYLPSIGVQPDTGLMRAMIGSGNRYALLDKDAGMCRFDNPDACAKYACGTVEVEAQVERINAKVTLGQKWSSGSLTSSTLARSSPATTSCGTTVGEITKHALLSCSSETTTGPVNENRPNLRRTKVSCGMNADGQFACTTTSPVTDNHRDVVIKPSASTLAELGNNRFFGVRIYGAAGQMFDETLSAPSTNPSVRSPAQYDDARLTDRSGSNPAGGDLVNVTSTTCTASGTCSGNKANEKGAGWVLDYEDGPQHKTASGASVLSSCALWNVMYPHETITECASSVARSRFFQANFITGEPNCASSLQGARYQEKDVSAPPTEPTPTVEVSKSGKLRLSAVSLPPGADQAQQINVSQDDDMLQNVYELPLGPAEHACRHSNLASCEALAQ